MECSAAVQQQQFISTPISTPLEATKPQLVVMVSQLCSSMSSAMMGQPTLKLELSACHLAVLLLMAAAARCWWLLRSPRKPRVWVLDFAVHKPHDSWLFSRTNIRALCEKREQFTEQDISFQEKIALRAGLGDKTAVCPAIQSGDAQQLGIEAARFEFGATCFPAIQEVMDKAGVRPHQIDFIVTNSSLFNPTPSLSAAIMNHFKMSARTINYSLGGMGCSAGVIALDLARELLQLHPNKLALVVSHENITNAYYCGKDRSMLIPNVLFRCNGAAVLLTNKAAHARTAKYRIPHIVRTNMAADDVAFNCVMQTEDAERKLGVRLNKDLVKVGGQALRHNMTALGPHVLPLSEQAKFGANLVLRLAAKRSTRLSAALPAAWLRPYVPDFRKAFDFFCIHTGGRGIIDGLEKEMALSRPNVEPSRASLYRFGNTSSTSVWYELAYIESLFGVARGQRVWQLAFGSGFKFNSAVLVANRPVAEAHPAWEGFDAAAMWVELDAMESQAAAERAARAKLSGGSPQEQQEQ